MLFLERNIPSFPVPVCVAVTGAAGPFPRNGTRNSVHFNACTSCDETNAPKPLNSWKAVPPMILIRTTETFYLNAPLSSGAVNEHVPRTKALLNLFATRAGKISFIPSVTGWPAVNRNFGAII
jgi:hypothetical protein